MMEDSALLSIAQQTEELHLSPQVRVHQELGAFGIEEAHSPEPERVKAKRDKGFQMTRQQVPDEDGKRVHSADRCLQD